jgi:hypothetical protein
MQRRGGSSWTAQAGRRGRERRYGRRDTCSNGDRRRWTRRPHDAGELQGNTGAVRALGFSEKKNEIERGSGGGLQLVLVVEMVAA